MNDDDVCIHESHEQILVCHTTKEREKEEEIEREEANEKESSGFIFSVRNYSVTILRVLCHNVNNN